MKNRNRKLNTPIFNFWKHLTILTLFLGFSFFIALYFLWDYRLVIIDFLKYFERAISTKTYLRNSLTNFSFNEMWPIILGLSVYFYFFEYVRNRKVFASQGDGNEAKYVGFIYYSVGFFNYALLVFLLPYLLFVKAAYIELASIVVFFLLTKYLFITSLKAYTTILLNYQLIETTQPKVINRQIEELRTQMKLVKNFDNIIDTFKRYIRPFLTSIALYILSNIDIFQKTIFFSTFLVFFFGLVLNFNLLSIIYLLLTSIVWFWILSILSTGFPKNKIEIDLVNGEKVEGYIIEDNPNGYYTFLKKDSTSIKVMKSAIIKIKE